MLSNSGMKPICILVILCLSFAVHRPASGQAPTPATASTDPFIGKWKLDPSRSKLNDEMKVAGVGENKYAFDFGAGQSETIVTDGTDQAGGFGTTLAVTVKGPNAWMVVRKKDGRTLIRANWELSPDGNTLTDHFGSVKPDGSTTVTDYVYKRTAGEAGFPGTWESTLEQPAFELQVQAWETDGLAFMFPAQTTKNIKFDGKDYPATGPNLPAGFTSSGHRVNGRAFELAEKVDGQTVDTQQTELSADLKTLTMTVHMQSQSKPKVYVFDRE